MTAIANPVSEMEAVTTWTPGRPRSPHFAVSNLQNRVDQALADHPHFRGRKEWIRASAAGEEVRIEGCLPSWYLLQLLLATLGKVPGVARIDNKVHVRDWVHPCQPVDGASAREADRVLPR